MRRSSAYFSRRKHSNQIPQVPAENWVGFYSPVALIWGIVFLTVPFAYIYILLVLLREACMNFATLYAFIQHYVPPLGTLIAAMRQSSTIVELWCAIEAIFYVYQKLYIRYLQNKDPLEASLSAAPLMDADNRQRLWRNMMDSGDEPVAFVTGWFFDENIENISKYDLRDFICWSMFEARHQEHLTLNEVDQLESFCEELEYRISLHLYGFKEEDDDSDDLVCRSEDTIDLLRDSTPEWRKNLPKPKKLFHFPEEIHQEESNFFSNLYESYRHSYESMLKTTETMVQKAETPIKDLRNKLDFYPIQNVRTLMAEAEESAMATGRHVYETLVPTGSSMENYLTAMSHATYAQLTEAWNSMKNMKERLETARFLSKQRHRIEQQLKGYRVMLHRMLENSSAIPSKQMASLMRRITECNEAKECLESLAQSAFHQATGYGLKNIPFFQNKEPRRYAKYSSDPLLGMKTYPLGLHMLVLGCTEIPLRILLRKRGFERRSIGSVVYYFHPGTLIDQENEDEQKTPIIFVHGIGIGLLMYMPLIDALLKTGRPIMLPEIPYVSAFRFWQSPNSVLQPAVVCSTMTAMLATHGFLRGTWTGHSYGTSWLSYMCKYAPHAVSAVCFLDPICFCLHAPRLTKSFVYVRPDPGTISYFVRTDLVVNWTIQRSFPWAWIVIFTDQIRVPCHVFLSEKDALVPSDKVEAYFRRKEIPVRDFDRSASPVSHFERPDLACTVFRGDGHGAWTERPSETVPTIASAIDILCSRADKIEFKES